MHRTPEVSKHLSPDVLNLYARLKSCKPGDEIPYEELSSLVGRDVQHKFRYLLDAARNKVLREFGICFRCVTNKGLCCLDDVGKTVEGHGFIRRARAAVRKGQRVLHSVEDYNALPEDKRKEYLLSLSVLGAIDCATSPKRIDSLAGKVALVSTPLPTAAVFQALIS